ncbi:hypothetical protein BD311DRAFT_747449 [Dichomitus squalens]|uniref:Uncharacterized protein n=1 Tax=Dichomitus squalens TaxID=114155 RepID=A0A4Q9N5C0_9APHY|nr:hypothetical protein BD311DRAFT_747449 [Dichomitus squalens]
MDPLRPNRYRLHLRPAVSCRRRPRQGAQETRYPENPTAPWTPWATCTRPPA